MRSGKEYIAGLSDDRQVFVDGARVDDVATHGAFRGVVGSVASLYDIAVDPSSQMAVTSPETGHLANAAYLIPRTNEDLVRRRGAITKWAHRSFGYLGRSPDHVASFFAGFASAPELFTREGRPFGDNITAWYRRILEDDLFLSYVIIPPQVDRSTTAGNWEDEFLQVGVKEERDDGIVLRGSQMLGTGAAISDVLFVSCIKPLAPGDEAYAFSAVVPLGAKGLRVYCRRPYALGATSDFDYPLTTRFDEPDAFVVFDDVFVPFSDVFALRDVAMVRQQFFDTAAHVLGNTQAQIRFTEKVKFAAGIARKVAATNGIDRMPPVQETLGILASLASVVEGMVLAAESTAALDAHGVMRPNPRFLYGAMGLQAELYPRVIGLLRDLAGGGVLQLPSSIDELSAEPARSDMDRYLVSPGVSSEERIKLFKLAWDVIGSEFAGRHQQYEMFYAGAPYVARGYAYRNYGYDEPLGYVEEFMSTYDVKTATRMSDNKR